MVLVARGTNSVFRGLNLSVLSPDIWVNDEWVNEWAIFLVLSGSITPSIMCFLKCQIKSPAIEKAVNFITVQETTLESEVISLLMLEEWFFCVLRIIKHQFTELPYHWFSSDFFTRLRIRSHFWKEKKICDSLEESVFCSRFIYILTLFFKSNTNLFLVVNATCLGEYT